MKIITPEIERLLDIAKGASLWIKKEFEARADALKFILEKHPALDYADELLEFAKDFAECDFGLPRNRRRSVKLIKKIEGRK